MINLTEHKANGLILAELAHVEKLYDQSLGKLSSFSLSEVEIFLLPINWEGTRMILFLGFIGMWLWMPKENELEEMTKSDHTSYHQ